tara:strand:- start:1835 stop:2095 length:261 start_codon:yes stop_codon:yes gene_type:complete
MINFNKYKNKNITLSANDEETEEMSFYELSRWMSLLEGVEFVSKKCEQLGIPDSSNTWIKPNALRKYVDERTPSMLFEITNEDTIC